MVRRHPVILASIARHLVHGTVEGARQGYQTVRTQLARQATSARVRDRTRRLLRRRHRLAATERAVELVERALSAEVLYMVHGLKSPAASPLRARPARSAVSSKIVKLSDVPTVDSGSDDGLIRVVSGPSLP